MKKKLFLHLAFAFCQTLPAQTFYNTSTIQRIEISFLQANWDYILDTAKQGSDSYLMSKWVKINGIQIDSAGVKYKGNSSYNQNNLKNPLHIELDHFVDKDYQGIKDIKLSNGFNEPSFVREVYLYNMLQNYTKAPRANFAQVIINGQYMGVYTNVEAITKSFLESRFYTKDNTFVFADQGGCNLRYKGADTTQYYIPYTMKSDYGFTHLMRFCDTLKNNITKIENSLDVDRTFWHLAFNNLFVTLDSYTGNSTHNYYMYRDHNKRFNPINWDLNGGIGIFAKLDFGPNLTIAQMQTITPLAHQNDTMWPLIHKLLTVPLYKRMYIAHMKTMLEETVANGTYSNLCQYYQNVADTAVFSDPYKFGTYSQFTTNLTQTVVLGPKTVPGLFPFMNARMAYLNTTPEFTAAAPTISNVSASSNSPALNSTLFITANIGNANFVYLGSRANVMQRFSKQQMFDDGLHGDGASGDGVYGANVTMTGNILQYYIYADNNNAGKFSPVRAEHEYHVLYAQGMAQPGQVAINEFLSLNQNGEMNEFNQKEDWIEIYNKTNSTLSLGGYYITDAYSSRAQYPLPASATLAPNGFLILWADGMATGLHTNFKLQENGEQLMLSDGQSLILDSVTFGNQVANVSTGRCADGIGNFAMLPYTSYGYNNCWVGMKENAVADQFIIYPNPSDKYIHIKKAGTEKCNIEVMDISGRSILSKEFSEETTLDISSLQQGAYLLKVSGSYGPAQVKKVVKE